MDGYADGNWRGVLVDSFCQAGKTKKCFEILLSKITTKKDTLVLFVTQANSAASVNQVLQRASAVSSIIPTKNIYKSSVAPMDGVLLDGNHMVVDFWNSRNMAKMIEFVESSRHLWKKIIIVIDECEQGGDTGVKERLNFIRLVERKARTSIIKVILVTATIGNLSKSILRIASANLVKFGKGIVSKLVNEHVVEHHFALPHDSYVGASWFRDTPDVWKKLLFPAKKLEQTKEQYTLEKEDTIVKMISAIPDAAKELSLIVTSTNTDDHRRMADKLYRIGYNVIVELNGIYNKNYKVTYVSDGILRNWNIPYTHIDNKADTGSMGTRRRVKTGIECRNDYALSHVLQAALFMDTDAEDRIKANVVGDEFLKLVAISDCIDTFDEYVKRPEDYPMKPRVALIAGHLAGRGITIQNPVIDFTCTSFCFTDTKDVAQRGATNTQRFGRACGMLGHVFARPDRQPILIATDGIIIDAIANEVALREKANMVENGTLISLKDLVTKDDWDRVMKTTKNSFKAVEVMPICNTKTKIEVLVSNWLAKPDTIIGKVLRYVYQHADGVQEYDLKMLIKEAGSSNVDEMYRHLTRASREYGHVFTRSGTITMLKHEASEYIRYVI